MTNNHVLIPYEKGFSSFSFVCFQCERIDSDSVSLFIFFVADGDVFVCMWAYVNGSACL